MNAARNRGLRLAAAAAVIAAGVVPAAAAELQAAVAACEANGAAILAGNPVPAAIYQTQVTRYDPPTGRCYVEMRVETTAAGAGTNRVGRFLYEGTNGELLAFAETRSGQKSGRVFDLSHTTTTFENSGWDDAVDYIRLMMTPGRGQWDRGQ